MKLNFKIEGADKIIKNLKAASDRNDKAVGSALYAIGNNVLVESNKIVPIDTSVLMNSGYCTAPKKDQGGVFVEVGYGGSAAEYAEKQHEDTSISHKEGRESKFLQKALNLQQSSFINDFEHLYKKYFKGGSFSSSLPTEPE